MAVSILQVFILIHFRMRWSTEAQERIGCFRWNNDNTVLSVTTPNVGSIDECIQRCQTRRATTYAGVRAGNQCYCGDSHNHTVNGEKLSDSSCTTRCKDQKQLCGGQYSIVIYSVCNRSRYLDNINAQPNCDASCNCKDNHICLYRNGSCPVNCEPGWTGEACSWRVNQPTTIQSEDEHLASSDGVSDMVTQYATFEVSDMVSMSSGYGVSEHMTANPALSVTQCDGCPDLLTALCVTSICLVISIIVNIYLAYRLRAAGIPDKQLSANIRATYNSSDGNSNDTQYENMGGILTEPSNYEHLGSRQTNPATYEELGMAGPTRG